MKNILHVQLVIGKQMKKTLDPGLEEEVHKPLTWTRKKIKDIRIECREGENPIHIVPYSHNLVPFTPFICLSHVNQISCCLAVSREFNRKKSAQNTSGCSCFLKGLVTALN